jgi:hypothetical protein
MAKDILKEAIADAKTVREVALANAKSALEEAFTPKLQSMLSAKLTEELDEDYYEDGDEDLELGETVYNEDEDMDEDMYEGEKENSMDEEIDLEEILNELELEEGKEADDEEVVSEENSDDNEEVDLEELARPIYKAEYTGTNHHYTADKVHENEEFDLDSLLNEINSLDVKPKQRSKPTTMKGKDRKGMRSFPTRRVNESRQPRNNGCQEVIAQNKGMIQEHRALSKELKEVKKAFTTVKGELNEVNLLNSKLLYVNRIFKANSLDDSQKLRVVETLDKAGSIKEAKLIYETIKDSFSISKETKKVNKSRKPIKENFGMASKAAGISRSKISAPKKAIISESDNMVSRFQKLANIKFK